MPTCFAALMQSFLKEHLPNKAALSPRTVESYGDALRMFIEFTRTRFGRSADAISLADFAPDSIQAFLKYAAPWDLSPRHSVARALAVPMKHFIRSKPDFLSREQIHSIIGVADGSWLGQRDHLLLCLLYNTAATVSEIIALRLGQLVLDGSACVHFRGRRTRTVPLWPSTVQALRQWLARNPRFSPESAVVPNQHGGAMTPTSIRRRLTRAVRKASAADPELAILRISPRSIRHSAAMHLLQCGTDLNLITHWLGHDTPATMHNHARAYRARARVRTQQRETLPQPVLQEAL